MTLLQLQCNLSQTVFTLQIQSGFEFIRETVQLSLESTQIRALSLYDAIFLPSWTQPQAIIYDSPHTAGGRGLDPWQASEWLCLAETGWAQFAGSWTNGLILQKWVLFFWSLFFYVCALRYFRKRFSFVRSTQNSSSKNNEIIFIEIFRFRPLPVGVDMNNFSFPIKIPSFPTKCTFSLVFQTPHSFSRPSPFFFQPSTGSWNTLVQIKGDRRFVYDFCHSLATENATDGK